MKTLEDKITSVVEIGDTLHSCGCAPYKIEKMNEVPQWLPYIGLIVLSSSLGIIFKA